MIQTHRDQFGQVVHECPVCGQGFYVAFTETPLDKENFRWALDYHARRLHRVRWLLDRLDFWALDLSVRRTKATA